MTTNYSVYSASLTALDTQPVSRPDTGEGAPGNLKSLTDYATVTTAQLNSTSSLFGTVRIPTTAKLKSISFDTSTALDSSTGLTFDFGAYYSDAASATNASGQPINDGSPSALAGTVVSGQGAVWGSNIAAQTRQNRTALVWSSANKNKPLWKALGLSSDPGGFFDVVVKVHTVYSGTPAAGDIGVNVDYVM